MGAALNTLPGASEEEEVVINQPTLTLDLQIPWHRLGLKESQEMRASDEGPEGLLPQSPS